MNAVSFIKSNINKDTIRRLLDVAGAKQIQDMGDNFRSTCPLHRGDNPSAFTWNFTNGLWFCFTGSCGGGDVFDFVADYYDMSVEHEFKEVVKKTAEVLELDISNLEYGERTSQQQKELRAWIDFVSKKKIVVNPIYDLSKLGDTTPLNSYRHYTKETIDFFHASYNKSMNRIQIPLYNSSSECIGASLRRVDEQDEFKWLHRPKHVNTKHILYNMNNNKTYYGILVEGAFDVWGLHQIGITQALGTLGAHLADMQADLIIRNYPDVLSAYDNDKAGRNATRQAINKLGRNTNLKILELGTLHDPGEITSIEQFMTLKQLTVYEWVNKYGLEPEKVAKGE